MFLLADEVAGAAEAFAQKFDDVRRRHRVLWGRDPFADAGAVAGGAAARASTRCCSTSRCACARPTSSAGCTRSSSSRVVADAAAPLRTAAASLLELEGRSAASPKVALREVALALGGPATEATLVG